MLGLALLGLAQLGLSSCATISGRTSTGRPVTAPALLNPFAELPPGATFYFYADIEKSRSIIDGLYRLGSVKALQKIPQKSLSGVGEVYGAFYSEGKSQRFYAQVSGRFPVVRTFLYLTFSSDWKKKRTKGLSYWRSDKDGLSLHIDSNRMIITDGIPMKGASEGMHEDVNGEADTFSANLAGPNNFVLIFNEPRTMIQTLLSRFGPLGETFQIPVEKAIFRVYPSAIQGLYEVQATLVTSSSTYGKALGALISLATRFLPPMTDTTIGDTWDPSQSDLVLQGMAALLLSERPVVEGPLVSLSSKPVTETELTLLLYSLLVYFEQNKLF
jgi:hypothetical protein